jgi:hypothetical protein
VGYGENSYRYRWDGCQYGMHAEMDSIRRLYNNTNIINPTKKRIKVSLIVIRINRDGDLKNSKPCYKCVCALKKFNDEGIYKIKNIYYSNADGNIEIVKLNDLVNDINKHISMRFRIK